MRNLRHRGKNKTGVPARIARAVHCFSEPACAAAGFAEISQISLRFVVIAHVRVVVSVKRKRCILADPVLGCAVLSAVTIQHKAVPCIAFPRLAAVFSPAPVFQVPHGFVVIGDMRISAIIECNRRIQPHIACGVC
jgi:hypothetical protein